jgi:hydrogenase maturation protease
VSQILIAGIGNVFFGDDGFGVEVARRLAGRNLPEGVKVVDFGIRGFDLTYALLEGYDAAILIDLTQRGGRPGTLYVIEPDTEGQATSTAGLVSETHAMNLTRVFELARAMGAPLERLRLVGCEPFSIGSEDEMVAGLSPPVEAAVEPAVSLVCTLIEELRGGDSRELLHA